MIKKLFLIGTVFLPSRMKVFLYSKFFGWKIHKSAKIGFSLLMPNHLRMGKESKIGSLTLVKGLQNLYLSDNSSLGKMNWVTGFPLEHPSDHFKDNLSREPSLYLGEHSAITGRHIIECTSKVTIGRFTTFAGFRSQILTHSIDLRENKQASKEIEIGDYCFIGTGCILLPGAKIHNYSILSAGAVVVGDLRKSNFLFGGVPAKEIKKIDLNDYKYLTRKTGYVI